MSLLPEATRTYVQCGLIVRNTEPGHYVAALTSLSGRYFRLYRLSMSDDGRITVGERITPTLNGTISGLAVSTEGRIAYGRITDDARFVGTLEREWPVSGYRLQWLNARILALPERSVPAGARPHRPLRAGRRRPGGRGDGPVAPGRAASVRRRPLTAAAPRPRNRSHPGDARRAGPLGPGMVTAFTVVSWSRGRGDRLRRKQKTGTCTPCTC